MDFFGFSLAVQLIAASYAAALAAAIAAAFTDFWVFRGVELWLLVFNIRFCSLKSK